MRNNSFICTLFEALNAGEVTYCVLRNYDSLPHSLNGSDLDILIGKVHVDMFYSILDSVLKKTGGRVIIRYGKLASRICIVSEEGNDFNGIQLDVHEGILPFGTSSMFPVDFLLSRVNQHENISVANDSDADFIAFLKEVLNNKRCKNQYFVDAKVAWNKNKVLYIEHLLPMYNESFIGLLTSVFGREYNKAKISALAVKGRSLLSQGLHLKIESKLDRMYRFFKPPGFTIAFLGTDGAGKTTIINAITEALNESVHNALYYEHMRPNIVPNIAQLFGGGEQVGPVEVPHSGKPSGKILSLVRLFYYSFDYIVGYWVKVYPITVKKSSIWIFDRYYYDYLIDPKRACIDLPPWVVRCVRLFIPKPDLILCLGADAAVIHKRKPELPLGEVVKQVSELKLFCDTTDKAVWIDTGDVLGESVSKTMRAIVGAMASRYDHE